MFKNKIISLILLGLVSVGLAGCNPVSSTTTTSDTSSNGTSSLDEWIDYAHSGQVQLQLDYEGRDFYQDGIGQVTVTYINQCIDGDTVHFDPLVTTTSRERIKSRFYGVDTPESTGQIQPWGKAASEFTKEHVWNAAQNGTIVLSSPYNDYHSPEPDSTGERYVTLVWINETKKNAPKEELILLNLWLVQEGLSTAKNVLDFPEMANVFLAAENQAKAYALGINVEDPNFNDGEYREDISLLYLKREIEKSLEDENYVPMVQDVNDSTKMVPLDGQRIKFTGTVAGFSNHILYVVQYFTEDEGAIYPEGEYAGINIFVGMSPIPSKYTEINTFLEISGTCVDGNFGFQISDVQGHFPSSVSFNDYDTKILLTPEENVDEDMLNPYVLTSDELDAYVNSTTLEKYKILNTAVEITDPLTVEDVYIAANDEITLYFEDTDFNAYITFMYRGDPTNTSWIWTKEEDWIGKRIQLSGVYVFHDSVSGRRSWQINPCDASQVIWVDAPSA